MTHDRITPAAITALAALIHETRPDWDRRGIAGAAHQLADTVPPIPLAIAFLRAAANPSNDTPYAIVHLNNHAWDTDGYPPCPTHPNYRARRVNGECGACHADRNADTTSVAHFTRKPPPVDALTAIRAELRRPHPLPRGNATTQTSDTPARRPVKPPLTDAELDAARRAFDAARHTLATPDAATSRPCDETASCDPTGNVG